MSYDIYLTDPVTGDVLSLDEAHRIQGGTRAVGGTRELWLNVTYNYAPHFYRLMGEDGIREIYGLTGAQSIPVLERAAAALKDDVDPDYWKSTEGDAREALLGLLAFAKYRPDGIWNGD